MGKLYVFAIGGSGSRVLRSLTMLMANGVECNSEIVPMIIDPDFSNGDLVRTVDLMRLYSQIHSNLIFSNNTNNKFFSTELSTFGNEDFLLPLVGTSGITFENYIELNTMSYENQAFMKMLFSNSNLSSDMNVGFKGNPNIGSVVLNQFTESVTFKNFETDFVQGDSIFIISSIFGGTGASGFPLLLKNMRCSNNTALRDAPIGAVTLLPYFNLRTDEKSSIKADSFVTKAKAALNYYEKNVTGNNTLNDMYYLGDDLLSEGYDNCDGGGSQQNKAHIVELLAALAIIDFSSKEFELPIKTNFHEFGLNSDAAKTVTFNDFGLNTQELLIRTMAQFSFMISYLNNRDKEHRISQKWAKDRNNLLGDSFYSSHFFKLLLLFKNAYEEWIDELKENHIGFKPFLDDDKLSDVLEKIDGFKPKYGVLPFFTKKGHDLMDERMGKNLSKIQHNTGASQTFMELFYITTKELCEEKLKI